MRTALVLTTLAAASLLTACSESSGSTAMKYDEAARIVVQNFTLVWPDPVQVASGMVNRGNGCRTNPETLKSEGPPWSPTYEMTAADPSQEFIDRALARLETMTSRGFALEPDRVPNDDPINRVYADSRGFSVAAHRDKYPVGTQFTITSSSPCVDE
ncbi:hypothetical protein OHB26_38515 [Nocardia sp. NBC_01503]|uniref:hypothetical protein n=1 Tax=Nocardia sp. NBC_01503 TaxID=2975997 RepID=UPI002E7AC484|nr:hypothetical protein [Nocardia sp. NBC_01503]WTL32673.1 hypothetical protein OHB26_38515 [Nocardia sp. NBC_01503]